MGKMKELLATVYGGGDEAVAAVTRMGEDWREMLEQAAKEVEAARLTEAEREAIRMAAAFCDTRSTAVHQFWGSALRGLLERLK